MKGKTDELIGFVTEELTYDQAKIVLDFMQMLIYELKCGQTLRLTELLANKWGYH